MNIYLLLAHRLLIKKWRMLRKYVKLLLRVVERGPAQLMLKGRVPDNLGICALLLFAEESTGD